MLQAAGVSTLAAIAGCGGTDGGDDGDDGDGDDGSGDTAFVDRTLRVHGGSNVVPSEGRANEYSAATYDTHTGIVSFDCLGHFSTFADNPEKTVGVQAKSWELVEADVFEVELYEGMGWTDGEEITAEDWRVKFKMEEIFDLPLMTDTVETVEVADAHTLRLNLQMDRINPLVLIPNIMNFRLVLNTPPQLKYGGWVEEFEDATSDSAVNDLQNRITDWQPTFPDFEFSGTFRHLETASDRHVTEINENHIAAQEGGHPEGAELNAGNYHLMYISPDVTSGVPVTSGTSLNEGGPNNQAWYDNLDDRYRVLTKPGFKGHGLGLNKRDDEFFAQREVTQAIQYAINTQNLADNIGLKKFPVRYPTGLKTNVEGEITDYVSEDVAAGLMDYNWNENDLESAAEKLREAGAEQNSNGEWIRPDGEQISFQIEVPPWDGYAISHETVSQTLNDFGFDVSQLNIEAQVWFNKLPNYDFTALNWFWGGEPSNARTIRHLVEGTMPEGGEPQPFVQEIPWPPGDPENDLQEIDTADLFETYRTRTGEAAQEAFDGLVWFINQAMPVNPYTERIKKLVHDTQGVNWPENGHVSTGHPRYNTLVYSFGWPNVPE